MTGLQAKKVKAFEANFRSLVFQKPSHSGCSIINCVLLELYTVYILLYTGAVQLWDILLGFIWPRSSIWSYVSTMDYATDCKEICIQSKTRYSQQYACALCRKDPKAGLVSDTFSHWLKSSKRKGTKSLSWSSFFSE